MALFLRLQYSRKITKFCFLDYNLKKKKYIYIYIWIMHYPTNQNLDLGARL